MSVWTWLIIIAAAYIGWKILIRVTSRPAPAIDGHLHGDGSYSFEVVGERSYQRDIESICGAPNHDGYNVEKTALLILEDDNPHDNQAVMVTIDGTIVGYLPRDLARQYRRRLAEAKKPYALCSCPALIRGGWNRGKGDKGPFGVVLDLPNA